MRKFISLVIAVLIMQLASLFFVSCTKNNDTTIILPTIRNVKPLEDILPQELIDVLDTIYDGFDPPIIEGEFLAEPYKLVYSTEFYDSIGYVWGPKYLRFENQTIDNTIIYNAKQGTSTVNNATVYLRGRGDNFTAYMIEKRIDEHTGNNKTTTSVMTGTMNNYGIKNYTFSYMLTETDGDEHTVSPNTIRKFVDGNNLAEKYDW